MKIPYYPGCTMVERAKNYNASGLAAAKALGIELEELPKWTCCGATFPLTLDRIAGLTSPARVLVRTRMEEAEELVTLCPFCYNTLKRVNFALKNNPEERRRINAYLKDDFEREGSSYENYTGEEVKVLHFLEVIRDKIGFENLKDHIKTDLKGLKVASYYGCMLLRPEKELNFDDTDNPSIMDELFAALGCEIIDFPHKVECCGSYISLNTPEAALQSSYDIILSAQRFGADAIAVTCSLCAFNLDERQGAMMEKFGPIPPMPILYFSQLLALALGVPQEECGFQLHAVDPRPLLGSYELISVEAK